MPPLTLVDLDELILQVRDKSSREYVADAVRAHRAGLNRAAIILVWTALAYDLEVKFRELAEQGEAAAVSFVASLDCAIASKNIQQLQTLESKLLDLARSPHEIIDDLDKIALGRLKEDRNMCAHPAFTGDNILFNPDPEQVRAHIVKAVSAVMQHPPLQGRSAFERLKADLLQPSFPSDQPHVNTYMAARYFKTLKKSLIGNLVAILAKQVLLETDSQLAAAPENVLRALMAAGLSFSDEYEVTLKKVFADQLPTADDDRLWRLITLLGAEPRGWDWLDEPTRLRIKKLLTNTIKGERLPLVSAAFKIEELAGILAEKFEKREDAKLEVLLGRFQEPILSDLAIRLFAKSPSYRTAEQRALTIIIPYAAFFTEGQVREILKAAKDNSQIYHAAKMPDIFRNLFQLSTSLHPALKRDWRKFRVFAKTATSNAAWLSLIR